MSGAEAFQVRLAAVAAAVESRLETLVGPTLRIGEADRPPRLTAAMAHAVLGGGKRLRPFLLVETARALGPPPAAGEADAARLDGLVQAAAAVELIHCYSLVHDDLPSMDDDDLRRGRPTVHRAFDEATAILAGDALLTLAFDAAADAIVHPDPAVRIALVTALARAAGAGGMVGGQILDLAAEGRFADGRPLPLSEAEIRTLQAMKTGALIRVSCTAGALLAGASEAGRHLAERFGAILGLAFQLADDLLDATGDAALMGKKVAKDAARGKGTIVQLKGEAATRAELAALVREAADLLAPLGPRGALLEAAARYVAERQS